MGELHRLKPRRPGHPLVHAGAQSPQTCILGVGATHQTHPGAPSLLLSLTFDHRAIDGAGAAALLADIARSSKQSM